MGRLITAAIAVAVGALLVLFARRTEPLVNASGPTAAGVVDYHVHILGPDVMRDWKAVGVTFSRPDSIYQSATSLLRGRGDSVSRVVLVPMAQLYGNPEFVGGLGIDTLEIRRRVRRENEWVAAEARKHAPRATALCSVPVRASWALEELAWCHDSLQTAGIKVHVASSQVDMRVSSHLDRLADIAAFASTNRLPMLLHVDPQRRGHDSTHIRAMAERMFTPHPALTVIVAHMGGSGGYGPWTRTVYRTLRGWMRDVEANGGTHRVYFDVSAVVLERESEGVPAMTADEAALLRSDLQRDGLDRFVFGSDYPVFDPLAGARALRTVVGLSEQEVDQTTRRTVGDQLTPSLNGSGTRRP